MTGLKLVHENKNTNEIKASNHMGAVFIRPAKGRGQHKVANVNGNNYVTQTNYSNDGITITLRNWYDANHALTVYVFECLFGTATGNGSALYQMK